MKRLIALLIAVLLIFSISGCRRKKPDLESEQDIQTSSYFESSQENDGLELPVTYEQSLKEGFTETAAELGITLDNYPIIDGSSDMHPLSVELAEVFLTDKIKGNPILIPYPEENSSVDEAYNNLIKGEVDIIFSSEPSVSQSQKISKSGVELIYVPIGYKIFTFAASPSSEISNISLEEINKAYISGNFGDFEIYADSGTDSVFSQYFLKYFMGNYGFSDSVKMTEDIVDAVKNSSKTAIGYTDLETAKNNGLKVLSLDGIEPSEENVNEGKYTYAVNYYAVIREESADNDMLVKLVDFLYSGDGKALVEKCGLYTTD